MRGLSFVPSIISLSKLRWLFTFFIAAWTSLWRALLVMERLNALCLSSQHTSHIALSFMTTFPPPVTCVYLCIFLITCFSCSGAAICRIPCKVKKMPELGLRRRGPSGQRLRASSSTMSGTKEKEATGLKMGWDGNPKAAVTGWVSALVCGL